MSFEGAYICLSKLLSNSIMGLPERILDAGFRRLREARAIGTPMTSRARRKVLLSAPLEPSQQSNIKAGMTFPH